MKKNPAKSVPLVYIYISKKYEILKCIYYDNPNFWDIQ